MKPLTVLLSLLALLLSCAEAPTLLIKLDHPLGFDPAQLKGVVTVELLDGNTGQPLFSRDLAASTLGSRQRIFDELELVEGRTYRVRLQVALEAKDRTCNGPAGGGKIVGLSPVYEHRPGLETVHVYLDCVDASSATGGMSEERMYHSATFLPLPAPHGKVLVAGGSSGGYSLNQKDLQKITVQATMEIYDPAQGKFLNAGAALTHARMMHQAVALGQDRVLLSGGLYKGEKAGKVTLSSMKHMDLYANGVMLGLQQMYAPRSGHAAVLLTEDRLLVAGGAYGYAPVGDYFLPLPTNLMELYNPLRGELVAVLSVKMSEPRVYFTAVYFVDGARVLLAGGRVDQGSESKADILCLSGACSCGVPPCIQSVKGFPLGKGRFYATGTRVPCSGGASGAIYVVGGQYTVAAKDVYLEDIYCLDTADAGSGLKMVGRLNKPRSGHSATLVQGPEEGALRLFVAGGMTSSGVTDNAELIKVSCGCKSITASDITTVSLASARVGHTATLLADGTVLLVGGVLLKSAERFNPSRL